MPLYTQQVSRYGSHVGVGNEIREYRPREYDGQEKHERMSVYSPHAVISLHQRHGTCAGCRRDTDLINDYCETCRACGANEAQCLNPRGIAK